MVTRGHSYLLSAARTERVPRSLRCECKAISLLDMECLRHESSAPKHGLVCATHIGRRRNAQSSPAVPGQTRLSIFCGQSRLLESFDGAHIDSLRYQAEREADHSDH